jgi:hypothetical protein
VPAHISFSCNIPDDNVTLPKAFGTVFLRFLVKKQRLTFDTEQRSAYLAHMSFSRDIPDEKPALPKAFGTVYSGFLVGT